MTSRGLGWFPVRFSLVVLIDGVMDGGEVMGSPWRGKGERGVGGSEGGGGGVTYEAEHGW